jgi:hypothetical protein
VFSVTRDASLIDSSGILGGFSYCSVLVHSFSVSATSSWAFALGGGGSLADVLCRVTAHDICFCLYSRLGLFICLLLIYDGTPLEYDMNCKDR